MREQIKVVENLRKATVQDFVSHTAAAYLPKMSLCVPVRASVSTRISSSMR